MNESKVRRQNRAAIDEEIFRLLHKPKPFVMRARSRAPSKRTADDAPDPRVTPPPHALASAQAIRRLTRPNALDPRLAPTDRHMQRWAVGQGSGFPDPDRAMFPQSRLTQLAPEIDIMTDQIVLTSPAHWRRFIVLWYRSDCSTEQLALDLGMGRDKLFVERRIVLAYLLGRLTADGIPLSVFDPDP
jgi:hypothetical protein